MTDAQTPNIAEGAQLASDVLAELGIEIDPDTLIEEYAGSAETLDLGAAGKAGVASLLAQLVFTVAVTAVGPEIQETKEYILERAPIIVAQIKSLTDSEPDDKALEHEVKAALLRGAEVYNKRKSKRS